MLICLKVKAVAVHRDKICITWYQYAYVKHHSKMRSSLFHLKDFSCQIFIHTCFCGNSALLLFRLCKSSQDKDVMPFLVIEESS